MDPVSMASTAVAMLAPWLMKASEAAASEIGKKSLKAGDKLLRLLWSRWKGKPEEQRLVEATSGEETAKANLQSALAVELASDNDFAEHVKAILSQETGPELSIDQDVEDAEELTGAEISKILRGKITIVQSAKGVKKVTGARGDLFG